MYICKVLPSIEKNINSIFQLMKKQVQCYSTKKSPISANYLLMQK